MIIYNISIMNYSVKRSIYYLERDSELLCVRLNILTVVN